MGEALNQCVEVLERDWSNAPVAATTSKEPALQSGQTLMALTVLKHIRDVLGGAAENFDPNVLAPLLRISPSTSPMVQSSSRLPSPTQIVKTTVPPSTGKPLPIPSGSVPSPPHPTLLLGSRADKPLPTLFRTPQIPQTRAMRTPLADQSRSLPNSTLSSSQLPTQVPQSRTRMVEAAAAQSISSSSKKSSTSRDPLLGLGGEGGGKNVVDPLGVLG